MDGGTQLRDELLSREELREKFGLLNYLVFSAMLLLSALIGIFYCWRGNRTTEDFLLASRSVIISSIGKVEQVILIGT